MSFIDDLVESCAVWPYFINLPRVAKTSQVIVSFMLTQTAGTPLWGRLCDIFGRRACLIFVVATFVIWSAACALSTTIEQLIIFRAFQGIGGGGIMSCGEGLMIHYALNDTQEHHLERIVNVASDYHHPCTTSYLPPPRALQ